MVKLEAPNKDSFEFRGLNASESVTCIVGFGERRECRKGRGPHYESGGVDDQMQDDDGRFPRENQ